jgi:hypothetical protein
LVTVKVPVAAATDDPADTMPFQVTDGSVQVEPGASVSLVSSWDSAPEFDVHIVWPFSVTEKPSLLCP